MKLLTVSLLIIFLNISNAQNLIGDRFFIGFFESGQAALLNGQIVKNWYYHLGFEPTDIILQPHQLVKADTIYFLFGQKLNSYKGKYSITT